MLSPEQSRDLIQHTPQAKQAEEEERKKRLLEARCHKYVSNIQANLSKVYMFERYQNFKICTRCSLWDRSIRKVYPHTLLVAMKSLAQGFDFECRKPNHGHGKIEYIK